MKAMHIIHRLEQMDQLIRLKATGSPKQFAALIRCSESTMYNYLDMLKEMGGPIQYNKALRAYEYKQLVCLRMGYEKE
ncbi:MAG: hypothetical protein ACKVUS_01020 [Saprospiraceae bacterium]